MALLPFGVALLASLLFVPFIRQVSLRSGQIAQPRADRWAKSPKPILGGVAMYIAFLTGLLVNAVWLKQWGDLHWGLLLSATIMFLLGLYDDFKRITPPAKLVGQIVAATIVIFLGYTTNFFTPRIENNLVAQFPNIMLTLIWIIGITNAINLLDNMDGLAGGISFIAAAMMSFLFWQAGEYSLLALSISLAGGILGFLVFNFPPASIFMGDSGSLFLGFTLAVLAIARQPQASNVVAIMGVPTLLFMLPILDTSLVTITRLLRGQSPVQGGRDHTSHRLIAYGLSERQVVIAMYAVALLAGLAGLLLETIDYWLSLFVLPVLLLTLALLTAYLGRIKVVVSTKSASRGALSRWMLDLTYRRRLFEIGLDSLLIGTTYYLAYLTYFRMIINESRLALFLESLPLAVGGTYLAFFIFGVYRGVWRYVGVDNLLSFAGASLISAAITAAASWLSFSSEQYPIPIFLFYAVFLFLGLAATRSAFKILDTMVSGLVIKDVERVLICGAGDAGEMAVRWILMNPELGYRAVGFLDNDPYIKGRKIHGVDILGRIELLNEIIEKFDIDGVVLTADVAQQEENRQWILEICRGKGCWVRTLRLEFEAVE